MSTDTHLTVGALQGFSITPPKNPTGIYEFSELGLYAIAFSLGRSYGGAGNWGEPVRFIVENTTGKGEFVFNLPPEAGETP